MWSITLCHGMQNLMFIALVVQAVMDKKGIAITLVSPEQLNLLRRVMMTTKAVLTKGIVPSADEVAGLKIKDVLDKVSTMSSDSS